MKTILIALTLLLTQGDPAPHQSEPQRGSVRGIVTRNGTTEGIPGTDITLIPAIESQAQLGTALGAAIGEDASGPEVQSFLAELSTMPPAEIQSEIDAARAAGAPSEILTLLTQMRRMRESNPGFPLQTMSDNAGYFNFTDVPPGKYTLLVHRDGFFGMPSDSKNALRDTVSIPLTVAGGPAPTEVPASLAAGAVISGSVNDVHGKPVPHVNVQAVMTSSPDGQPRFGVAAARLTDDRGEFRLFWLPPGDYVIGVNPRSAAASAASSTPVEREVRTYYPSATDMSVATKVAIKIGEERSGLDIRLRTEAAPSASPVTSRFKVSGTAVNTLSQPTGPDGRPQPVTVNLALAPRGSTGSVIWGTVSLNSASREFELNGIPPNSYDLYGQVSGTDAWGRAPVEVVDQDLDGIQLVLHPGVELGGVLKIDGSMPASASENVRVSLRPEGALAKAGSRLGIHEQLSIRRPDGSFTIPALAEGNYSVRVSGLPEDAYVADLLQGGVSVYDTGIDITDKPAARLEATIATNGGAIDGTILDADQKAAPRTTVVLIPPPAHRRNAALYRTATSDAQGHFSIRGIRPDDYTIVALAALPPDASQYPEIFSSNEARGAAVTVAPSTTTSARVSLTSSNAP